MGLLTISLLLLWSAVSDASELPRDRKNCASVDSAEFFFPKGTIGIKQQQFDEDSYVREWYSKHLRAMGEPSLSCSDYRPESYRFLWLRTFGRPIAVRIEIGRSIDLIAVELDGAGGGEPGEIARKIQRQLQANEWTTLSTALRNTAVWTMPSRDSRHGWDGAQWVFEGRSRRNYHMVDRWSPKTGAYRELCLMFVKLAGIMPVGGDKRDSIY
jgi:hypothetical protein